MNSTFQLYPDKESPLYAQVNIFDTKKEFLENIDESLHSRGIKAFEEGTQQWDKEGNSLPIFSNLYFYKEQLDPIVVVHELYHASFTWAVRADIKASEMYKF